MTPDLVVRVRFPVDDRALSELHARAFAHPLRPDVIHTQPWAARLERHSIGWVGVFEADALVGFVTPAGTAGRTHFSWTPLSTPIINALASERCSLND